MKYTRLIMIIINSVFFLIGLIMLIIGICALMSAKVQRFAPLLNSSVKVNSDQMSDMRKLSIALIVIGSILMVLAVVGSLGLFKLLRLMHLIYAAAIAIIILAEIGFMIYFVSSLAQLSRILLPELRLSIVNDYTGVALNESNTTTINSVTSSWNIIQINLKCCGALNKGDYNSTKNWNRINPFDPEGPLLMYPLTCCPIHGKTTWNKLPVDDLRKAQTCALYDKGVYDKGCYEKILNLIRQYRDGMIFGAVVIIVIELVAFIVAIIFYRRKAEYAQLY
ncbi:unnamed protein product [Didymodactylos carnosus]|uniref:Tetraspanin n=1 Tax=Didymodactylos carnosus TaxID=1234261 RepID=A0A815VIW2_9BILA|nr:unnamed protein product [Didymodactylos carnosus]CAF1529471.1 unnamed protein product [Didymodactylos carnosus]CAF4007230.1 unnamed protein product [Didymodactylos carnosus]CAF4388629.1 unnamed protein product [Didymodactylos carnosus]